MSARPQPALVPPLALGAALTCLAGAAALANCALLAALLRRSRNGILSLLIQLAVADFILLTAVLAPEIWSYNSRTWSFGLAGCMAFKGIDVFSSMASLYLVATLALHSLATLNVEEREVLRRLRRSDVDDEEIRSSRHSLVASSDSSTPPRTMNIDYRLADADPRVPVTPPAVFVWVLAASLSVPEFALSTTQKGDSITCALAGVSHRVICTMLAVFSLVLPTLLFSAITALAVGRLRCVKSVCREGESVAAVKLSLCLMVVYWVLCAPRPALSVYVTYSGDDDASSAASESSDASAVPLWSLVSSSACLCATLLRPVLCVVMLPRLRRVFTFGSQTVDAEVV